jgi:uncharacterized protein
MNIHPTWTKSIKEISQSDWDALVPSNFPFFRHTFLLGLEDTRCISRATGWEPYYLLLYENSLLIAAVPCYQKSHSYGEFIFDWSWADSLQRAGLRYYPKLISSAPFTPANGNRFLIANHYKGSEEVLARLILEEIFKFCKQEGLSSYHILHQTKDEQQQCSRNGMGKRLSYQYHWENNEFSDFNDYLSSLRSRRRKEIKRERKSIRENGIDILALKGEDITKLQLEAMFEFYASTHDKKWGQAYLNYDFFCHLFENMPENLLIILAKKSGKYIGGSFNLVSGDTLYGRYWGSSEFVPNLHFECCYYALIEYAINNDIKKVEAGAGGEHKFLRGFLASSVYSSHILFHEQADAAVKKFLENEWTYVQGAINSMNNESPVKEARNESLDLTI